MRLCACGGLKGVCDACRFTQGAQTDQLRLMDGELEQKIEGYIRSEVKKMQLKSKTVTGEAGTEVIYEIRPKDNDSAFVNRISGMQGVESAVMVSYDGNYAA